MNRFFCAENDKEFKERCYEVELLRSLLSTINIRAKPDRFKMFLDIHAHSTEMGAFIYAPSSES